MYDDCTRECLALVADTSISGRQVARELDAIAGQASLHRQRRHGADVQRHPRMGRQAGGRYRIASPRASRSRTPSARASTAASKALLDDPVQLAPRRPDEARGLAGGLQRGSAAFSLGYLTPGAYARGFAARPPGALRCMRAPRAGLLPASRQTDQITPRDSCYAWMRNGGQVRRNTFAKIHSVRSTS